MNIKRLLRYSLLIVLCMISSDIMSQEYIAADNPAIVYTGRYSFANAKASKMGYTSAQIHTTFTGTSISMVLKPNSGFYAVEIDGQRPYKVQSQSDSVVVIATNLAPGRHTLHLTQCNEAVLVKYPTFHGFIVDKGATLEHPASLPQRKIEFIGNSITCALGILDTTATKTRFELAFQDASQSFAAQTARRLNARYQVVARSGIGVYRNNGGNIKGDQKTMPYYYPRSIYSSDCEPWDFRRFTPDVVCINLGTNDTSQSYDINLFIHGMTNFLRYVHTKYPAAKIVVCTGTMRRNKRLTDLKYGLDTAIQQLQKEGITCFSRLDFKPADGQLGYGTGYHPSLAQHTQMADELTAHLMSLMNWK